MTNRIESVATPPNEAGLAEMGEFVDFGPPLRIKPGAVEKAIAKARLARAQAFHDTIGVLWRHAPRSNPDAAVHA